MWINYQSMLVCPLGLTLVAQIFQKVACFWSSPNFYPNLPIFLHGYIRHIHFPTLHNIPCHTKQYWAIPYNMTKHHTVTEMQEICLFSVWLHLFCRGRLSVIHLNPSSLWAPLPNPPEKPSSIPAFRVY